MLVEADDVFSYCRMDFSWHGSKYFLRPQDPRHQDLLRRVNVPR